MAQGPSAVARMRRAVRRPLRRLLRRKPRRPRIEQWLVSPEQARAEVPPSELADLFFGHEGHQVFKWGHYLPAYEREFDRYRAGMPQPDGTFRPLRMLEIGVFKGGSLALWRKYFGPEAVIWGIDINPRCATLGGDFVVRIGSQDDPAFLAKVVEEMGGVDLVLDDGSHFGRHQNASFRTLFPMLSDGGLYAVEDLHAAYWSEFEGSYRRPDTFIETVKALIDDMHAWYHDKGDTQGADAARTIPRIAVYDSVAFIEKQSRGRPVVTQVGTAAF